MNSTVQNKQINLSVIYDNNPYMEDLKTDWGFSCVIEFGEITLLFDTGDNGEILLTNMEKLGISPASINMVFLSHYHHDHTGGLSDFLLKNSKVKVFYPQAFPKDIINNIETNSAESFAISKFMEIKPNIYTLGEFGGSIPEQVLAIRSQKGILIITGCAHPGIIRILQKAKNYFPDENIHLVLGGFHLHRISAQETNNVIKTMFDMNVNKTAPTHCTGEEARKVFKFFFANNYIEMGVGMKLIIN